MAEMGDVIGGEVVSSDWGNDIRDRTVQRYATTAERTTEHGAPIPGDLAYMADTGDVDIFHAGIWRHLGPPVGAVQMLAGGSVPTGWLVCNGTAVSRTTYAQLFTAIGTTWGAGNGTTTFNVPDLRGKVPRGVAASGTGNVLGGSFGSDTHLHTGPSHSHAFSLSGDTTLGGLHNHTPQQPATHIATGGDGFQTGATEHVHGIQDGGNHEHGFAGADSTNTAGTGNTGSSSTIQAGAAIHFIIKT